MATLLETEFVMRLDRLKSVIIDAKAVLDSAEPTKITVQKIANKILPLIQAIEKHRPAGKTKIEEDPLHYASTAVPLLMDANDILLDLETQLSAIAQAEETKLKLQI